MNFSTLFRIGENLNLDRKTLIILRWIAIIGQLSAVSVVYYYLRLDFPIRFAFLIIFFGLLTNLFLQFKIKSVQIKDFHASIFLIYDLIQLSLLLYLTGGISNPFSILMIVPAIVSSTFLSMGTTIMLGLLTIFFLFLLTVFHYPLPGIHEEAETFPKLYLSGYFIAIIIGLIFLCYFGIRFAGEIKKRSEAFKKLQEILSKEYELESLGGQAAAAAHSLGTPLATISVVARELRKEIGERSKHTKDIDLLISQTKRCSEILKKISEKKIIEDKFISATTIEVILEEIVKSFTLSSNKPINLVTDKDKNKIVIKRTPEIVYGLRNFIGNAIKFSKDSISVQVESTEDYIDIMIDDDGDGFPEDLINVLGEPYISSRYSKNENKSGLGLGTFLGKTLLNRKNAKVTFNNNSVLGGARVVVNWRIKDLISNA